MNWIERAVQEFPERLLVAVAWSYEYCLDALDFALLERERLN